VTSLLSTAKYLPPPHKMVRQSRAPTHVAFRYLT
jgi:hypothetical protein